MRKKDDFLRGVRLEREGLSRLLGDREAPIMEFLWRREDVSVRAVHRAIAGKSELAYTTVMTIMDRLWKKGLLSRRQEGNAYLYTPRVTRESFMARCLGRILDVFLPDMDEAALGRFVDRLADQQPGLLDELDRLVRARRKSR